MYVMDLVMANAKVVMIHAQEVAHLAVKGVITTVHLHAQLNVLDVIERVRIVALLVVMGGVMTVVQGAKANVQMHAAETAQIHALQIAQATVMYLVCQNPQLRQLNLL